MTVRRAGTAAGLAALALCLASCGEAYAETYYNSHFGVELGVTEEWRLDYVNESNVTASPDENLAADDFDTEDNGDGGYFVEMVYLSNTPDEYDTNHAQLMLFAETAPGREELEDYLEYYRTGYAGEYPGYSVILRSESDARLGGATCRTLVFDITDTATGLEFTEEYYIKPAAEGFVVAYVNYWTESGEGLEAAHAMLKGISFTG